MIYIMSKVRDGNTQRLGMFPTKQQAIDYAKTLTDIATRQFTEVVNTDTEVTYAYNGDINNDIITIIQMDNE